MATYSNTNWYDGYYYGPGAVQIWADAHDLPSSSAFGGTIPTTQEDCESYEMDISYYSKLHGQTSFWWIKDAKYTGSWNASSQQCNVPHAPGIWEPTSTSGWDTHRVAIKLILRSSAQEVKVVVDQPLPK